jgi:cysteine-rich repeat protein
MVALAALAPAAALFTASFAARAVQAPPSLPSGLVVAGGPPVRALRTVSHAPPPRARRAWERFASDAGRGAARWSATWDEATHVPHRIWGPGIDAPGASASAARAERFARAFLERHLELLAPGARGSDFELVANETSGPRRVVAFTQRHAGMPVLGGQVGFRFVRDRLVLIASEALPDVRAHVPAGRVGPDAARALAESWITAEGARDATATGVSAPLVLPLVGRAGVLDHRVALRVEVASRAPRARWNVYLDAATGAPVAREQTLRFGAGTVVYDAPVRWPGGGRADYPALFAQIVVGADTVFAAEDGGVTFAGAGPANVVATATGKRVVVDNATGPAATAALSLADGGVARWSAPADAEVDAQLSAYVHTHEAQDHALALAPTMGWAKGQMPVNVNIDDLCNAFYDGVSINFYRAGGPCENTGRLADVVFHEYGHGFHHHAIIAGAGGFDEALSEGLADYFACSKTGDPAMGRGFFFTEAPLRHLDPDVGERVWPDDIHFDPHETGLILGGALWDLRKELVGTLGASEGVAVANQLYHLSLRTASDIPSVYPELLAADDDDGDLANGTPHGCAIAVAFGRHGLRAVTTTTTAPSLAPASLDGYEVKVEVTGAMPDCPADRAESAELEWRLRRAPSDVHFEPMAGGPDAFTGLIPMQGEGEVVQYRVALTLGGGGGGGAKRFAPDNPADPYYELFVGEVTPLYCTGFETDPALDGWEHGLLAGAPTPGADDWQWGAPGPAAGGDPPSAYEGSKIFGTDLGNGDFNGLYQPNKHTYSRSPAVDASAFPNARLQYRRWLAIEDGFFDRASIHLGSELRWETFASSAEPLAQIDHRDREWRFHDVDLRSDVEHGAGTLDVRFELESDRAGELGGWSLDALCIVGYDGPLPGVPVCGNGEREAGEECDDGDRDSGDGCDAHCRREPHGEPLALGTPAERPLELSGGCGCRVARPNGGAAAPPAWLALALLLRARRRGRVPRASPPVSPGGQRRPDPRSSVHR